MEDAKRILDALRLKFPDTPMVVSVEQRQGGKIFIAGVEPLENEVEDLPVRCAAPRWGDALTNLAEYVEEKFSGKPASKRVRERGQR